MAEFFYDKISLADLRDEEKAIIEMIKSNLPDEWLGIPLRGIISEQSETKSDQTLYLMLIHPKYGLIVSNINCIYELQLKKKDQVEIFRDLTISYNEEEFFKDLLFSYLSVEDLKSSIYYDINDESQPEIRTNGNQFSNWIPVWPILFLPYVSQIFINSIFEILVTNTGYMIPIIVSDDFSSKSFEKIISKVFYGYHLCEIEEYEFSNLKDNDIKSLIKRALKTKISLNMSLENLDETSYYPELLMFYELSKHDTIKENYQTSSSDRNDTELKIEDSTCIEEYAIHNVIIICV